MSGWLVGVEKQPSRHHTPRAPTLHVIRDSPRLKHDDAEQFSSPLKWCDTFWIGDEYGALEVAISIVDADGG
jgi:hypothetical protein